MTALTVLQDCRTIQLTKGANTLIDAVDWPERSREKWAVSKGRTPGESDYARRVYRIRPRREGKTHRAVSLHRIIMDAAPGTQVDHRNGDGLDNRRANLRLCTATENRRNRHVGWGTSKFKGVKKSGERWVAAAKTGRKTYKLGTFNTEEEAARAYDAFAREHYGEFACTNADIYGAY